MKTFSLTQEMYLGSGFSLRCVVTVEAEIYRQSNLVTSFANAYAPFVTMAGRCSNVQYNGNYETVVTPDVLTVYSNGELYFDISNSISISGGIGFVSVGASQGYTTRYRYGAENKNFIWDVADDISV